eukprot:CAMPEP_0172785134 /NCGR_PEP_ID=MMETSP1074-20121228/205291_1 /TAXON_ID=2916 /ORGANISM="Ceratium fusus, Strain PA161109" /LENGTH=104 /DNA_ID=CAMNT_0013622139 /DNA_START=448 /DNA_END=762 /DNA_ORIENTATION=-
MAKPAATAKKQQQQQRQERERQNNSNGVTCSLLVRCALHARASVSSPPRVPRNVGSADRWALFGGRTGGKAAKPLEETASVFRVLLIAPTDEDNRRPWSFDVDV